MTTVLVTGGSGFIGAHCILQLLAAGYEVKTTVRNLDRGADVRAMLKTGGAEPGGRLSVFAADLNEDEGWKEARVCRHLARKGWLEGEGESAFLSDSAGGDDGMDALRMSSITYRIATGAQAGRKVVTLQTLPGDAGPIEDDAGKVGGFSLHAGVAAEAHESVKLERLCRYIARPAISEQRLSLSAPGRVRSQLETPWKNGTTHVEFEPIEFIAKLAALVPPPRAHLTRFHGVFAPNAALRARLTPSGRGRRPAIDGAPADVDASTEHRTPTSVAAR